MTFVKSKLGYVTVESREIRELIKNGSTLLIRVNYSGHIRDFKFSLHDVTVGYKYLQKACSSGNTQ